MTRYSISIFRAYIWALEWNTVLGLCYFIFLSFLYATRDMIDILRLLDRILAIHPHFFPSNAWCILSMYVVWEWSPAYVALYSLFILYKAPRLQIEWEEPNILKSLPQHPNMVPFDRVILDVAYYTRCSFWSSRLWAHYCWTQNRK